MTRIVSSLLLFVLFLPGIDASQAQEPQITRSHRLAKTLWDWSESVFLSIMTKNWVTYDVGLQDEGGQSEFNPPSLRAVGRRRRFFHDGRAASLVEVFSVHQHQLSQSLSPQELADLVEFLKTL